MIYVPTRFQEHDWFEQLLVAGFDPNKPSRFIWESVTMYLTREAVEHALGTIAGTAAGATVAFDCFAAELVTARSLCYARAVIKLTGEPFRFGIDSTRPGHKRGAAFLASSVWRGRSSVTLGWGRIARAVAGFATARVR